jgi:hexokinase
MDSISDRIPLFLHRNGLSPSAWDLETITRLNLAQLRIGLYGGGSSIPVHPTWLTPSGELPTGEPVAVALVDEREIRCALVTFTGEGPTVEHGDCFPVPGGEYPAPLEDLLFGVAELLEPLLSRASGLVLALTFPLTRGEDGDRRILSLPSGLTLSGWEEVPLGTSLHRELESRGYGSLPVLAVQTSAAVLLDGVSTQSGSRHLGYLWDRRTGSSFAAPESTILKMKTGKNTLTLLDTGSGGFTGVPMDTIDLTLDRDAPHPGLDLMDKMAGTELLGDLFRLAMLKAAEAGLLTFMCSREFLSLRHLSLEALLGFLETPEGDGIISSYCSHDPQDRAVALTLGRAVLERAAALVCAGISALLSLTGAGRDAGQPAILSLWGAGARSSLLMDLLERQLRDFTAGVLGHHCRLHCHPDTPFPGAAAALLLNRDSCVGP